MKRDIASITATGWSRCGECLHPASRSSSTMPPDCLAIASSCAMVPYSSSKPWIASTGTIYWEGAVRATRAGKLIGRGYLELTGYWKPLRL